MKGRKNIALVLAFAMIFVLGACAKKDAPQQAAQPQNTAQTGQSAQPAQPQAAEKKAVNLKLASFEAADQSVPSSFEAMCEAIKEASDGRITITHYPASQLGTIQELQEALRLGTVDMSQIDPSMFANLQPEWGILSLPMLVRDFDHFQKVATSDLVTGEMTDFTVAESGVRMLGMYYKGFRVFDTTRSIRTFADRKSIKLRSPEADLYIQTFSRLGMSPTPIAWSEAYTAMQTGVVDGLDTVPDSIMSLEIYQLGKYITRANHMVSFNQIGVNEKVWQQLDAEDQALIQKYIDEYTAAQQKEMFDKEDAYYKKFEEMGCVVEGFDPAEADQVKEAFQSYWDEYIKGMDRGQKILDAILGM